MCVNKSSHLNVDRHDTSQAQTCEITSNDAKFAAALASLIQAQWPKCQVTHKDNESAIYCTFEQIDGFSVVDQTQILLGMRQTAHQASGGYHASISTCLPSQQADDALVEHRTKPSEQKDNPASNSLSTEAESKISSHLSRRERETALHMARGLSNKEIALRLKISPATVKVYTKSIMTKFSVRNRTEFAVAAMRQGLA
jgi:DNA-binding NarL/FixJ family response regulator